MLLRASRQLHLHTAHRVAVAKQVPRTCAMVKSNAKGAPQLRLTGWQHLSELMPSLESGMDGQLRQNQGPRASASARSIARIALRGRSIPRRLLNAASRDGNAYVSPGSGTLCPRDCRQSESCTVRERLPQHKKQRQRAEVQPTDCYRQINAKHTLLLGYEVVRIVGTRCGNTEVKLERAECITLLVQITA